MSSPSPTPPAPPRPPSRTRLQRALAVWCLTALCAGTLGPGPHSLANAAQPPAASLVDGPSPPRPAIPPTPARLRVRRGWATLLTGPRPERVGARNAARRLPDATFLSLGSDCVVELRWAGRGSLRITGPAELEWAPPARAGDELVVRFVGWREIDAESRRGAGLDVQLQEEGWSVSGAAGAWQLSRGLAGVSHLRHHGGAPLRVAPMVVDEGEEPFEVVSGQRLTLPAPEQPDSKD